MAYDTFGADAGLGAITQRVQSIKDEWRKRDYSAALIRSVLAGDWEKVAPGAFTEDYPAPMVANRIKVMSKDNAASLAPLPSVNCASTNAMSEPARKRADDRTKIANSYIRYSNLAAQHTDFATHLVSYGMGVYFIEPDFDAKMPKIRVRNGSNVYAVWNGQGETVCAFEEFCVSWYELAAQFEGAEAAMKASQKSEGSKITVVRYSDKKRTVVYLPECGNHILTQYAAPIPGECQYVCVPLPGEGTSFSGVPAGQFDDLVWPLMADHEFRMLALEAASKAVQAPLAVPPDVTDIPYGPDAVIRTQQPQNVRRVATEVPNTAFAASELIRQDLAVGGMSPEGRTGNIQASVITGKGVEALSAGYSNQIANYQLMIAFGLEQALRKSFKMDEHLWGNVDKSVQGTEQGAPFSLKYRPSKAIAGDYSVEISYGFLSGMAPNNALIFVLQAQAAGLISRDFAARNLPVGMNVSEQMHQIEIETVRNSLLQMIAGLAQGVGGFMMQGQDPAPIIRGIASITAGIKKGKAIEDLVSDVFAPEPPPAPAAPGSEAAPEGAAPGEAGGGGPSTSLTPGSQAMGPNDRPDLSMLFAGMSSGGQAVLQGGVSRQNPVQGQ
jgi:hypothetical protein